MSGENPIEPEGRERFTPSQKDLVDLIMADRQERNRRFSDETRMFADPAWDIFVDLASAGLGGRPVSVSSACIASLVPPSTALRYVRLLENQGLVARIQDALDGRRFLLSLTELGWTKFHGYVRWLEDRSAGRGRIGDRVSRPDAPPDGRPAHLRANV